MRALTQDTLRTTSSVELVGIALADHAVFKHVCAELQRRDVDARAAAIVVDAYRLGSAPPWLAAYMLGCARAPLGYEVAREILLAAPGLLAESYAGPAMARIAGVAARDDLTAIMMGASRLRTREGAAYGLGVLAGDIAAALLEAVSAGRVRRCCAGGILGRLSDIEPTLVGWLASGDKISEAVAVDAALTVLARTDGIADVALAHALKAVLSAGRVKLAPRMRTVLEERIAPALERAGR